MYLKQAFCSRCFATENLLNLDDKLLSNFKNDGRLPHFKFNGLVKKFRMQHHFGYSYAVTGDIMSIICEPYDEYKYFSYATNDMEFKIECVSTAGLHEDISFVLHRNQFSSLAP